MDSSNAESTVTTEYHDAIVGDANRQIHALEGEVAYWKDRAQKAWDRGDIDAAEKLDIVQALAESRARFADSEARRAELEAWRKSIEFAVDAFQDWQQEPYAYPPDWTLGKMTNELVEGLRELLRAGPSVVLEDRDRENRAIGWDAAIDHVEPVLGQTVKRAAHVDNPYRGDKT